MLNNSLIVFSSVRYLLMEVLLIKVNNVFVNLLLRGLIDNVFVGRYLVLLNMVKLLFDVSCGLVLM